MEERRRGGRKDRKRGEEERYMSRILKSSFFFLSSFSTFLHFLLSSFLHVPLSSFLPFRHSPFQPLFLLSPPFFFYVGDDEGDKARKTRKYRNQKKARKIGEKEGWNDRGIIWAISPNNWRLLLLVFEPPLTPFFLSPFLHFFLLLPLLLLLSVAGIRGGEKD